MKIKAEVKAKIKELENNIKLTEDPEEILVLSTQINALKWTLGKYYFIDEGIEPDEIYGRESVCCLDEEEVQRLSEAYETDLFEYMHTATMEEIQLYGVYDSEDL